MARPKLKNSKRNASEIEANKVKNRDQAKRRRLSQKSLQSAYENPANQTSEVAFRDENLEPQPSTSAACVENLLVPRLSKSEITSSVRIVSQSKKLTNAEKCKLYRQRKKLEKLAH